MVPGPAGTWQDVSPGLGLPSCLSPASPQDRNSPRGAGSSCPCAALGTSQRTFLRVISSEPRPRPEAVVGGAGPGQRRAGGAVTARALLLGRLVAGGWHLGALGSGKRRCPLAEGKRWPRGWMTGGQRRPGPGATVSRGPFYIPIASGDRWAAQGLRVCRQLPLLRICYVPGAYIIIF